MAIRMVNASRMRMVLKSIQRNSGIRWANGYCCGFGKNLTAEFAEKGTFSAEAPSFHRNALRVQRNLIPSSAQRRVS
jgi:hypothetical protein